MISGLQFCNPSSFSRAIWRVNYANTVQVAAVFLYLDDKKQIIIAMKTHQHATWIRKETLDVAEKMWKTSKHSPFNCFLSNENWKRSVNWASFLENKAENRRKLNGNFKKKTCKNFIFNCAKKNCNQFEALFAFRGRAAICFHWKECDWHLAKNLSENLKSFCKINELEIA